MQKEEDLIFKNMSIIRGPKIVSSGIALIADAADKNSYSGSGTSWFDLSGNKNTGTLVNAPTFSSLKSGSFAFNGTTQYVDCGNASDLQITVGSISCWILANSDATANYRGIITKQNAWGIFMYNNLLVLYDWGSTLQRATSSTIGGDGLWHHVCLTFTETSGTPSNNAIVYLNSNPVLTTTVKNLNQTVQFCIGSGGVASQYFTGSISNCSIYNRVLSAAEVLVNFNAQRKRFGV